MSEDSTRCCIVTRYNLGRKIEPWMHAYDCPNFKPLKLPKQALEAGDE